MPAAVRTEADAAVLDAEVLAGRQDVPPVGPDRVAVGDHRDVDARAARSLSIAEG
ncbi:MAG: hypothetical protein ACFBWO_15005 [Paracoccaceae bacterium]